ncbi:MAG: redoxin domain-containing protein [Chitinivibrionales bacterium]|nr:redoxin domain-containing protein [Chitinivibrionales bacterium]MBD3358920.1 redoxin domain-containing protein [Chitinivibrionales bacterium]
MKRIAFALIFLIGCTIHANQSPRLHDTLPDFSLTDTEGKTHRLSDYDDGHVMLFTLGYG